MSAVLERPGGPSADAAPRPEALLPPAGEPAGRAPDVSVVVLTWNSCRHVEACIGSLDAAVAPYSLEVVVVDNGSTDGTPELVSRLRPGTRVVRNARNRGVAAGRNQGLALSTGRVVVLLDVDTIAAEGALRRLVEHLDRHPGVALCGPRLILPDGSVQPSCQKFPTALDKMFRVLPRLVSAPWLRGVEMRDLDHTGTHPVDYVVGACQAIRRAALAEVGWLDERMFYGPEDVDLCLRLQARGWSVDLVGAAVLRHECQRVTRWRLNGLALRHGFALVRFFRAHGYLWSRRGLYARLSAAHAARRAAGTPPVARATVASDATGRTGARGTRGKEDPCVASD